MSTLPLYVMRGADWYNDDYEDPREYIESLKETEEAA
jgi:hypothetical protein